MARNGKRRARPDLEFRNMSPTPTTGIVCTPKSRKSSVASTDIEKADTLLPPSQIQAEPSSKDRSTRKSKRPGILRIVYPPLVSPSQTEEDVKQMKKPRTKRASGRCTKREVDISCCSQTSRAPLKEKTANEKILAHRVQTRNRYEQEDDKSAEKKEEVPAVESGEIIVAGGVKPTTNSENVIASHSETKIKDPITADVVNLQDTVAVASNKAEDVADVIERVLREGRKITVKNGPWQTVYPGLFETTPLKNIPPTVEYKKSKPKPSGPSELYSEVPIYCPQGPETPLPQVEIRLITILPAFMGESIICQTFKTNLKDKVPFIALSYAWGSDKKTRIIQVRGCNIPVTESLHQALLHLRKPHETVTIWADAICINQESSNERNHQVKQMTKIYSAAEEVAVWIGVGTVETDRVINLITASPERLRKVPPKQAKEDLKLFFSRDYWHRVWVVQEIASVTRTRRTCTLRCGEKSATLEDLKLFLRRVRGMNWAEHGTLFPPRALLTLSTQDQSRTFLQVLREASRLSATYDVDRIYGIRGISPKVYREKIEVDYGINFEKLSEKVTSEIINNDRCLDFLCVFQPFVREKKEESEDVRNVPPPSWLRDFRKLIPGTSPEMYSACKHRQAVAGIRNQILFARGICVGTVSQAILFAGNPNKSNISGTGLTKIDAMFMTTFRTNYPQDTDHQRWNRFAEMILGGKLQTMDLLSNDVNPRWKTTWEKRLAYENHAIDPFEWDYRYAVCFRRFFTRLFDRCCFSTVGGRVGLGPWDMKIDDIVCVLYGCCLPVVLRKNGRYHMFVGPAYLDGAMSGEYATSASKEERFRIR